MARYGTCLALVLLLAVAPCPSSSSSAPEPAQHTLGTGSSLSVEDHGRPFLTSPDGTFSCGFQDAGENAFSFSVWYTDAAEKTAIWTANPGAPVNGRGSRISFRRDGGLALDDANGSTVWESKTSGGGGALTISLLDTGNLLISDPSTGGRTLWQSFDWPTDTLVPSQPLTKDKKLVAGYFSLYYDNDNVLRLLYDSPDISSIYWPNNPINDPFKNGRTTYNSSRIGVLDDNGLFLSSDNLGVHASDFGPGVKRRLTMDQDGNVRIYSMNASTGGWAVTWAALGQPCSTHGLCGQNALCEYQPRLRCSCPPAYEMVDRQDWRKGCKPMFRVTNCSQPPSPSPEQQFKFLKLPHSDFYGYDLQFYQSVTFEYCKKLCLKMCLCVGFSYKPEGQGFCYPKSILFNGFTSSAFSGTIYLKVPIDFDASAALVTARSAAGLACDPNISVIIRRSEGTFSRTGNGTKWPYLFAFAGVLGVLDIIFIATSWWFLSSKQSIPSSLKARYRMVTGQFRRFTYRELKDATGNFKEELGRGGSGVVYRGVLDKGKVVAVKKLTNVAWGDEEFWAEMTVIGRINHMNLVRIWGFCSQGKHKLLVYEYVENESLDRHLFGTDRTLPWRERYRIALGTARGLAYLHHECLEWVIHCDVKPENILLTREFDAKIADFGLAKLSKRDGAAGDSMQLSHMRGTTGYMAPEWALNVPINAKVDVYSYGIVLLEIVMGCRVCDQTTAGGERREMSQIAQALRHVVATGNVVPLVDGRLQGQFNPRQALEMVRISLSCMEDRSNRPTMDDVAKALTACDDEDEHPAYR
ncbi:putative receptor protein kinase ZmPK1 [Miscanthus floridulus]|uniref:putative receptor protein kinase ZmPK1 n=1 Tax=Miscanthus floridulus TaxID=154761 RepID=UPI0034578C38